VFDNSDDIEMWVTKPQSAQGTGGFVEYLPKSDHGCIIFTTCDRKAAIKLTQSNIIEVPEMNEKAATQLLKKCLSRPDLGEKQHDTKTLLVELTYLPLAIVQASAYINENEITLADYASLLDEKEVEIIDLLSEELEDYGRYNVKNQNSHYVVNLVRANQTTRSSCSRIPVVYGVCGSKGHTAVFSPARAVTEEGDGGDSNTHRLFFY
jgi:hypothetical protein